MNNGCCRYYCNNDILEFVDKDATRLLRLLEFERLHLYSKEVCLHVLPFPTSALLAVLELYLLHGGDKLVGLVIVDGLLLKEFVVEYLSAPEEECKPTAIKQAAQHKDGKDEPIVRK